jgi:hypothetical protein
MFNRTAFVIAFAFFGFFPLTTKAETCMPLPVVGGEGSEITKTISHPNIPGPAGIRIARNNWNTDWAVPGGKNFRNFVATITSETNNTFNIRVYLKFSDQTSTRIFRSKDVEIGPKNPLVVRAEATPNDQPFQVNVWAGGLPNIGKTYTALVVGCY